LYYSQFTEETSQEQAKKKGFQDSQFPGKTLVCRRERVKINRNCSRTCSFNDKMVLFASLLVGMLRFNYKGRKYQDSFPKEDFPQRLENTSCWITSAEDYYLLMSLYKTQETMLFSLWLPFAKGVTKK